MIKHSSNLQLLQYKQSLITLDQMMYFNRPKHYNCRDFILKANNFQLHNPMLIHEPFTITVNQTPLFKVQAGAKQPSRDVCRESREFRATESRDKTEDNNLTKESITEKQMLSHQTIRDLLLKSAAKVILHEINKVSPQTKLYKTRRRIDHLAKSNPNFTPVSPVSSQKNQVIQEIYKEFKDETPAWKKIQIQSQTKNQKILPLSKPSTDKELYHSKNISISGLTTYNFRSVKARYRLAYDSKGTEEEVSKSINLANKKAYCSIGRTEKIYMRTCPSQAKAHRSLSQVITHNFSQLSTEKYLKAYQTEKKNSSLIYGEPFKDYCNASKIMAVESADQETAEFAINEIKLSCRLVPSKFASVKKVACKQRNRINAGKQLERRRFPAKKSVIIVSGIQIE